MIPGKKAAAPIVDIKEAIHAELDAISASRERRGVPKCAANPDLRQRAHASQLLGLAFSGGGIRSATFNLGIVQALAELGILNRVDYLSTVSGGGYIGSWLVSWMKRAGFETVVNGLCRSVQTQSDDDLDPIFALRRYSNYLAPKLGFFSADTWTIGAVYIQNLLLNQMILVATLGAVLMFPRLLGDLVVPLQQLGTAMVILSAILLAAATSVISFDLRALIATRRATEPLAHRVKWLQTPTGIQVAVVFPIILAAFLLSVCGNFIPPDSRPYVFSGAFTGILLSTGAQSGWDLFFRSGERYMRGATLLVIASALPGISGGLLMSAVVDAVNRMDTWHLLVWGTPVFVGVLSLITILHLGLLGSRLPDEAREWWSRLGALVFIYLTAWAALSAVAIYGPLILTLGIWAAGMGAGWLLTSGLGAAAARNPGTGTGLSSRRMEVVAQAAPFVFIAGLLMIVATGLQALLAPQIGIFQGLLSWPFPPIDSVLARHWQALEAPDLALSVSFIVLLLEIALIFSMTVDVNEFSMHQFYRNRLVRAYLGASRNRRPEPFTGFDPHDDMPLATLAGSDYTGPYPIINTALNIVQGEELAWQERKAASFSFTPLFSGFQLPERKRRSVPGPVPVAAFRPTSEYAYPDRGGIEIGTAIGISGAAASPSMGYHTSAASSFLMTMFNVRLGWWLGNPARGEAYRHAAPPVALYYLLKELLGKTDSCSWYLYLSDGGHFENLGVYELVRRRCRCIIACDAGQDETFACDDLANAIRKCRTDLGIAIDIDVSNIRDLTAGQSKWHCAVGRIHYEQVDDGATPGTFIYVKASVTGDETADVLNYAARNRAFPHQTTADQFFNESQFESYRSLGYHIASQTFSAAARGNRNITAFEEFLIGMRERWYPASAATAVAFSRHGQQLQALYDQLRNESHLSFLDAQMYPEWPALMSHSERAPITEMWLPSDAEQLRAGFFFCNSLIQLMESVYLDLNLETDAGHPDNRGWINLFKHWSWSGMFRSAWAISVSTYGARFQTWSARNLDLKLGTTALRKCDTSYLNFHEQHLLAELLQANPGLAADHALYALENRIDDVVAGGSPLALPFGFAVVRSNTLYFMRIQDHLRRMGLAHASIKVLVDERVAAHWSNSALMAAVQSVKSRKAESVAAREIGAMNEAEKLEKFQSIFDSVMRDTAWRLRAKSAGQV